MIAQSISSGLTCIRQRFGLVVLLYAVNLIVALAVTIPLYLAIRSSFGPSGFGPDLLTGLDFTVWPKAGPELFEALRLIGLQSLFVVPIIVIWKVASSVGIINALRDGKVRKFWAGVGQFTGRGLGLALIFGLLGAIWLGLSFVGAVFLRGLLGATEAAAYNSFVYFLPISATLGLSFLALLHDYSKICLVKGDLGFGKAFKRGSKFALANPGTWILFAFWLIVSAVLLFAPSLLDRYLAATTISTVVVLFVLQQLFLFFRTAASVAWYGSEVEYYEAKMWKELPLIAETPLHGPEITIDDDAVS